MLTGRVRHELACSACGAPLHDLKAIRTDTGPARKHGDLAKASAQRSASWPELDRLISKKAKSKKKKKKKSFSKKAISKAFDLLDDVFD
ncbi:MAG: hypothetical protein AAGH83_05010 [Pseudomonadota bacterium]